MAPRNNQINPLRATRSAVIASAAKPSDACGDLTRWMASPAVAMTTATARTHVTRRRERGSRNPRDEHDRERLVDAADVDVLDDERRRPRARPRSRIRARARVRRSSTFARLSSRLATLTAGPITVGSAAAPQPIRPMTSRPPCSPIASRSGSAISSASRC